MWVRVGVLMESILPPVHAFKSHLCSWELCIFNKGRIDSLNLMKCREFDCHVWFNDTLLRVEWAVMFKLFYGFSPFVCVNFPGTDHIFYIFVLGSKIDCWIFIQTNFSLAAVCELVLWLLLWEFCVPNKKNCCGRCLSLYTIEFHGPKSSLHYSSFMS